ncbi:MAG: DMT family transporter [Deltaproteobacteria bacterium]|nr:MAG: DMT family transporter [Deltaproteobacteria bacterium]
MDRRSNRAPQLAVLVSTLLWGTLWIPVRRLHEAGSGGAAVTTLGFLLPLALLLPAALARGRRTRAGLRELRFAGFWLALGIALYVEGLVRGQIARVILLFYLTPVWGTLLARIVLREPITGRRLATIALGFSGMLAIFGIGAGIPVPRSAADGMGLAAGFAWAIALLGFQRGRSRPLFDRVFVQFVFLAPIFFAVTLLPGDANTARAAVQPDARAAAWLLAFALLWMLPVIALTVYAARYVDPGRFAILLMFEIVVGLATAALLTDEPFGARELAGAILVMGAIAVEIGAVRPQSRNLRSSSPAALPASPPSSSSSRRPA